MERRVGSPTTELSRGLDALQLGRETPPNESYEPSTGGNVERSGHEQNSQFNNNDIGAEFNLSGFHDNSRGVSLVFSHLEHTNTTDNSGGATGLDPSTPFHSGLEQNHYQRHYLLQGTGRLVESRHDEEGEGEREDEEEREGHTQLLAQLQSLSVSAHHSQSDTNEAAPQLLDHQSTVNSLSGASANISDNQTQWAWSRGGSHGNCREEALGMMGYVDDVTVDDLAGYFDQMLHLPRPMSEMAQLMYT